MRIVEIALRSERRATYGDYRSENMLAMLESLRSKFGGAEGYIKQKCGLNDEDIRKIRSNIVEKNS